MDCGNAATQEEKENHCIDAFHALSSVRANLASGLASGELLAFLMCPLDSPQDMLLLLSM